MTAMMGAFLGFWGTLISLILGSLIGAVAGSLWIVLAKKDPKTFYLPFATFLGAAALIVLLSGGSLVIWYEGLIGAR